MAYLSKAALVGFIFFALPSVQAAFILATEALATSYADVACQGPHDFGSSSASSVSPFCTPPFPGAIRDAYSTASAFAEPELVRVSGSAWGDSPRSFAVATWQDQLTFLGIPDLSTVEVVYMYGLSFGASFGSIVAEVNTERIADFFGASYWAFGPQTITYPNVVSGDPIPIELRVSAQAAAIQGPMNYSLQAWLSEIRVIGPDGIPVAESQYFLESEIPEPRQFAPALVAIALFTLKHRYAARRRPGQGSSKS